MKKKIKKLAKALAIAQGEKIISPYFNRIPKENLIKMQQVNRRIDQILYKIKNSSYLSLEDLSPVIINLRNLERESGNQEQNIRLLTKENKNIIQSINSLELDLRKELKMLASKEFDTSEIEALTEGIAQMRIEFLSRIANLGGGAMNRQIKIEGTDYLKRYTDINLIGSGVTITAANNDTQKRVDITFTASGSGYQIPVSGNVDGMNQTFTFATAPTVIVVDQGRVMQRVSSDGNINWTGTTTIVLQVAPNFDIFGL